MGDLGSELYGMLFGRFDDEGPGLMIRLPTHSHTQSKIICRGCSLCNLHAACDLEDVAT